MKLRKVMFIASVFMLVGTLAFSGGQSSGAAVSYGTPGQFPLEKTLTLRAGMGDFAYDPADNPVVQKWEEETNVHLEWMPMETDDKRNIVFASDDYPDFSLATGLWMNFIAGLLNEGVAVDLVPYLKQGYTPNLDRLFAKYPNSYAYMLNPEGKLQALARHRRLESNYLEQNYMINRKWLDALGLKKPTTTDELLQVLIAFRDRDPNGNGKKDEIPFAFVSLDGFARHERSLYGLWGLPTKNGIAIRNGKALFAPIEQGYKDFIKTFAYMYREGLLDREVFTMSAVDMDAKVDNPSGNVIGAGVFSRGYMATEQFPNRGEFESMSPLQVPGYPRPEVWVHPGYLATKNFWFMTDNNPEPEITMAWVDLFYTFERSIQTLHGPIGDGIKKIGSRWVPQQHPEDADWGLKNIPPAMPFLLEASDFDTRYQMDPGTQFLYDNFYTYYADYVATEQWNRPEFTVAEAEEVARLGTDINKLWKERQARWISGAGNVDDEWDDYVKQMKRMNVDRYTELHFLAHDRFAQSQK